MSLANLTFGELTTQWAAWNAAQFAANTGTLSKEALALKSAMLGFGSQYQQSVAKILQVLGPRMGIPDAVNIKAAGSTHFVYTAPRWLCPVITRNPNGHTYGANQITCLMMSNSRANRGIRALDAQQGNDLPYDVGDYAAPDTAALRLQLLHWFRTLSGYTGLTNDTPLTELVAHWISVNPPPVEKAAKVTQATMDKDLAAALQSAKKLGCQSNAAKNLITTLVPEAKTTASAKSATRGTAEVTQLGRIYRQSATRRIMCIYMDATRQDGYNNRGMYTDGEMDYIDRRVLADQVEAAKFLNTLFEDLITTIGLVPATTKATKAAAKPDVMAARARVKDATKATAKPVAKKATVKTAKKTPARSR